MTILQRKWIQFILAIFVLAPVWLVRYFPSQDGPSHLHNAMVLNHIGSSPTLQEYYAVRLSIAGNVASHFILAGLLRAFPPEIAEKLLLTLYVLLFLHSFQFVARQFNPRAAGSAFLAAPLVFNFFVHMGFWNYCLSIPALLYTVGLAVRWSGEVNLRRFGLFAALGFLLHQTHLVSLVLAGLILVILGLWNTATGRISLRNLWLQLMPAVAFVPVAIPVVLYCSRHISEPMPREAIRFTLTSIYSFSPLMGIAPVEGRIAKLFSVAVVLATMLVARERVRNGRCLLAGDVCLCAAMMMGAAALFTPDRMGLGSTITWRIVFTLMLMLTLWLAATVPERLGWIPVSVGLLFSSAFFAARAPVYRAFDNRLREYASIASAVEPESTFLALNFSPPLFPDPYLHASGWITSRMPIVDLMNYEAATDAFLTAFRPNRSFVHLMSSPMRLPSNPGADPYDAFRRMGGRIDYIAVYDFAAAKPNDPAALGVLRELKRYDPVATSRPGGLLRLYRSKPAAQLLPLDGQRRRAPEGPTIK